MEWIFVIGFLIGLAALAIGDIYQNKLNKLMIDYMKSVEEELTRLQETRQAKQS